MNIRWLIDTVIKSSEDYPHKTFEESGKIYTCINPYKYHMVRQNPGLYKEMDGIFVDGILMVRLFRICLRKKIPRLSFDMTAIAKDLFKYLNKKPEKSIYFIGSRQEFIEESVSNFKKSYPNMDVKGFRNGYFNDEEDRQESIKSIVEENPTFTIVGLGGNVQEQYALDLRKAGYNGIIFTCGGFLHQSAQNIQYYPEWIDHYNLRAVYRIFKERNFKRLQNILLFIPQFIYDSMRTK